VSTVASRFLAVGALGFAIQISALGALSSLAHWPWLPATIVAVELAVVHNFLWHERWTWADRRLTSLASFARFVRFNVSNGLTSIVGNVALMAIFVKALGMPAVLANVLAVGIMSATNFLVADRWVFQAPPLVESFVVVGLVLLQSSTTLGAEAAPKRTRIGPFDQPQTVAAWDRYVAQAETRIERARTGSHAASPETLTADGESIGVPSGTISDWHGAVFIRGMTLDRLLHGLTHPGTPPPQEDVAASRVLSRTSDSLRVYIRLVRHAIVTVTYDTEHEMTFRRWSPTVATARSVATRIEQADGGDHGFLWRLHSYWRYEEKPNGVLVELESLTLSRDVPALVRPIASPLVNRIARESTYRTLEALRRFFESRA